MLEAMVDKPSGHVMSLLKWVAILSAQAGIGCSIQHKGEWQDEALLGRPASVAGCARWPMR